MSDSIVPFLWFKEKASEVVKYYQSIFDEVEIIHHTPLGSEMEIMGFRIMGTKMQALTAPNGPDFSPAISLFVYCGSDTKIESFYDKLMDGGSALMPLGQYPWTSRYAWVQDKYGVNWQLDVDDIKVSQKVVPAILFFNENKEELKPAFDHYRSLWTDNRLLMEAPHALDVGLKEGSLLFSQIKLDQFVINGMSSTLDHDYGFSDALSLMIVCHTQDEIDHYYENLVIGGKALPCGWLHDSYGVPWQVVPESLGPLLTHSDKAIANYTRNAMMGMKKFIIADLTEG